MLQSWKLKSITGGFILGMTVMPWLARAATTHTVIISPHNNTVATPAAATTGTTSVTTNSVTTNAATTDANAPAANTAGQHFAGGNGGARGGGRGQAFRDSLAKMTPEQRQAAIAQMRDKSQARAAADRANIQKNSAARRAAWAKMTPEQQQAKMQAMQQRMAARHPATTTP